MRKDTVLWSLLMTVPRGSASLRGNIWRMLGPGLPNRARAQERQTCYPESKHSSGLCLQTTRWSVLLVMLGFLSPRCQSWRPCCLNYDFPLPKEFSAEHTSFPLSLALTAFFSSLISLGVISQCQFSPSEGRTSLQCTRPEATQCLLRGPVPRLSPGTRRDTHINCPRDCLDPRSGAQRHSNGKRPMRPRRQLSSCCLEWKSSVYDLNSISREKYKQEQ